MNKTIFIGDSLTAGFPGVSYFRFLSNKKLFINKGLGGDTLSGATRRTVQILNISRYNTINNYIIEIGTNDVLLPVLANHSLFWNLHIKVKAKILGCTPCTNKEEFRSKYDQLISLLLVHNKQIGIIGLPLIENNTLKINDIMKEYDQIIRELCSQYNIPYFDLMAIETKLKGDNRGSSFFGKTNIGRLLNTVFTSFLPFSMLLSKHRGLAVTVDSTHLNSMAAKEVAKQLESTLLISN